LPILGTPLLRAPVYDFFILGAASEGEQHNETIVLSSRILGY
jgi:hypothetical protein